MKNILKKHKVKIIFIIILIFQVITIMYAASKRVHLHMDEYLSFGFISSEDMFINLKEDFYNTWHSNDYFYEYLEINEDEVNDFSPVYENQKNDVHPPLYYLLLRIFNNFSVDSFTIWFAIALNVVLFIISMCIVYLIGEKLFKNKKYTLLLCFMVGFNIGIIQIAIYIRMYQLLILSGLLLLYWHLYYGSKAKLEFKDCLKFSLVVCMGFLTHYYFIILLVAFYIVYFIQNIKEKNIKNLIKYTLTLIISLVIVTLIFPYWINHMFFSGRGKEAYNYLLFKTLYIQIVLYKCFTILNKNAFNYMLYAFLLTLALFITLTIYYKIKNKDKNKFSKEDKIIYVLFPTIFYFIITSCVLPYVEIRYFSLILVNIIIFIVYYLKKFGEYVLKNNEHCFNLILALCVMATIINLLNVNNNIYTYRQDEYEIKNIEQNKNLIYIIGNNQNSWYDSYEVFLNYENSIILKYNENIVEEISNVIEDKNLKDEEYIIGIDENIYVELKEELLETQKFKNLKFLYNIGRCVFVNIYTEM